MKILYFHQHFKTPAQKGGTRSYEFAKQLILRGHKVCMVYGGFSDLELPQIKKDGTKRGMIEDIEVVQFPFLYSNKDSIIERLFKFIRFAWKGIKIALTEDFDLLFATSTPLTAGIPGIVAKCFRKTKFVFEVRDLWPELPKALGMKNPFLIGGLSLLEYFCYLSADACIGLSPGICEGIKKRAGQNKPITLIPNGCDLEVFKPAKSKDINLKGINPTDIIAVFTGAHGIANGLDAILNAAKELKQAGREDIKLVFIGDGKLKNHLIKRSNNEGLNNCLFFDPIPKIELNKIVASADIGLMVLANVPAFYYGTSPNKFFDYISCGLPVLNNYPGWLADMITTNNLGIVVPPDDAVEFAKGLIRLADDCELRKTCGNNARKFAESNFSREKLSNEFVSFIENISQQCTKKYSNVSSIF